MSWSIYTKGTKKGVAAAVERHKTDNDPDQYAPVKALLLAEIEKIDDSKFVDLEAAGSCSPGYRSLTIKLTTGYFEPDPVEEVAA